MSATCVGPPLANGLQPLSCLRCAQRKVRCDRVVPCSNCNRHSVVCEFPQPKNERRRRRKMVVSSPSRNRTLPKLDRYKEVFGNIHVDAVESIAESLQETIPVPPRRENTHPQKRGAIPAGRGGHLVVAGKRTRYIEGELWTRIGTELDAHAMFPDSDTGEDDDYEEMFEKKAVDGLSRFPLRLSPGSASVETLYPTQEQFRHLWKLYLSNIHPITMILHAPSASKMLTQAIEGYGHLSKDTEALLFATMLCALISITDCECERLLGEKKSVLFSVYRQGCEISLMSANFLVSFKLRVLQAYTLYLVAIGAEVDPCEMWNLTGIAKRNAQRLGLHQEVLTTGLTPFEVEMRRRLWSQIIMQDMLAAHRVGLQWPVQECKMIPPSNVNDADLHPEMEDPPKEREGLTDMIFCNLLYKVTEYMGQVNSGQRPWALATEEQWTSATIQLYRAEREKAVAEMEEELELETLRYCDILNPIHLFTVIVARLTLCKLRYLMLQPCQYGTSQVNFTKKDRASMFSAALKVLEYENKASGQLSIQGFLWHGQQHFSWLCLTHVLEELKIHPCGVSAEEAWEHVQLFYDLRPDIYQSTKGRFPLYSGINKMAVEAWQIRETQASVTGELLVSPRFIAVLREHERNAHHTGHEQESQHSSTASTLQTVGKQALNQELPSMGSNFGAESGGWLTSAGFPVAASHLLGNYANFWDPILHQEHPMLVNNNNLHLPQTLTPPFHHSSMGARSIP
ncbi:hypothetical protein BDV26DRAFT_295176 [Aspergillus bertholletiae]|uniref:Zn(2)-C6 fungal-type domain-containing protein n=1 Tax=Aspergillus bertholletiae TaxID=1226010 RepID=A0A5N7AZV1_9EURO|nr:hypothetical protein BDV26DRAFT_295176 [Aspergillus bertholletiae]